jgi:hypothetical protein
MKRPAITLFALLYMVLIVSGSIARAQQWAAENPKQSERFHGSGLYGFSGLRSHSSHTPQTRILEHEYVVDALNPDSPTALPATWMLYQGTSTDLFASDIQQLSSRSPPFFA